MVISDMRYMELITHLTTQLNMIPRVVVVIDKEDTVVGGSWGYQPGLWVKYVPGQAVVQLTCPGHHGQVVRGVWAHLTTSLGPFNTVCNMKNKQLRIAHNTWQPYFAMETGTPDNTTMESIFLNTLLEKHSLTPVWVDAGQSWGGLDKTTGKWTGAVGLVII